VSSPAQRYAAAKARRAAATVTSFEALYEFPLDPFQLEACRALEEGHGVLVAAPLIPDDIRALAARRVPAS
jgi:ATP-dependent RNA helicase HelY